MHIAIRRIFIFWLLIAITYNRPIAICINDNFGKYFLYTPTASIDDMVGEMPDADRTGSQSR